MAKGKGVILVTGATGQQGGAVARELVARKHTVRAMTRKPDGDAGKALARQGAEVVKGDLNDAESLRRALQGAWGVFAVQNTWEAGVEGEEVQGKRIAELARKTGVEHYVYTSVGSAHRKTGIPHFDNKWRIEETVRGLGFPSYVILRPVFFMDNFLSPWFKPGIDQGKLMIGLKPSTVLQMIAVKDVGKYGLVAFERAEELNRKEIDLAGDAHTMPQAAQILSKATGRSITFQPVPLEDVRKASEDYALMLEWFDRVGYDADISGNAKRYGINPTMLAAWAASARWS
jgi:uncharacterized protein YbjT (DUF2867 family)